MNKTNNKRSQESKEFIEEAFGILLQNQEYDKISVSDICKKAGVNRSTFYAHYTDVYDLMESIEATLSDTMNEIFIQYANGSTTEVEMFKNLFLFVKMHKHFYLAYLSGHITTTSFDFISREPFKSTIEQGSKRLSYISSSGINYHFAFFATGISEVFRLWLANDCKDSVDEMVQILIREYNVGQSALGLMPTLYSNS